MKIRIALLIVAVGAALLYQRSFRSSQEDAAPPSVTEVRGVIPPPKPAENIPPALPPPVASPSDVAQALPASEPPAPASHPASAMDGASGPIGGVTGSPGQEDPAASPERVASDLDEIALSLRDYRTVLVENPVGNNAEITRALMGGNPKNARLAPPDARVNGDGQMIDRWGKPYFFHQISATSMEIHSSGPDKKMGTEDDVIHR